MDLDDTSHNCVHGPRVVAVGAICPVRTVVLTYNNGTSNILVVGQWPEGKYLDENVKVITRGHESEYKY